MTKEQQKEQFSIAYVRAVAAAAGVNIYRPEVDADSLDIGFAVRSIIGRLRPPRLEAQLKCTTENGDGAANLRFELKIKNYNELRGAHLVPRVLIVVVVPKRPQDWLSQDHESLALHHCGYWLSLRDMPEMTNRKSVIVRIPRTQIFTVAALRQFLGAGGTV
ncbi:MAG TPA: DUF4365 domain-containing protein [Gemmataceae bacterium]|jgi:hypothetical protein